MLLSQDEARFPMVPTLTATLGGKGHRPVVGTGLQGSAVCLRGREPDYGCGPLEHPGESKGRIEEVEASKTRPMQVAFIVHLRHVAHVYPVDRYKRVVLLIDNAPWHRGGPINDALRDHPHLEFKRLPRYSPQLNPIERFWKVLRRRATHNRLFDTLADLKGSLRNSDCYFQTVRDRMKTLLNRPLEIGPVIRNVNEKF